MQYLESSVLGLRSAAITLKRRTTPMRFLLLPMVHIGERSFYATVSDRLRGCDLIVAEGTPSRTSPIQTWMSRLRVDDLVDQLVALDLESLGPPVQWELPPPEPPRSTGEQVRRTAEDAAGAVLLRLLGRYGNPRGTASLDESDEHDDRWARAAAGGLDGYLDKKIRTDRDAQLIRVLSDLHRRRYTEEITIGVVWGALHIPAVVDHLTAAYKYDVEQAEWLTVFSAG